MYSIVLINILLSVYLMWPSMRIRPCITFVIWIKLPCCGIWSNNNIKDAMWATKGIEIFWTLWVAYSA